jgi:hypothetical protein
VMLSFSCRGGRYDSAQWPTTDGVGRKATTWLARGRRQHSQVVGRVGLRVPLCGWARKVDGYGAESPIHDAQDG